MCCWLYLNIISYLESINHFFQVLTLDYIIVSVSRIVIYLLRLTTERLMWTEKRRSPPLFSMVLVKRIAPRLKEKKHRKNLSYCTPCKLGVLAHILLFSSFSNPFPNKSVQHVFHYVVIKIRQLFLRSAACLTSTLLESGMDANDCSRVQQLNVPSEARSSSR
jgi:hypothetical protein